MSTARTEIKVISRKCGIIKDFYTYRKWDQVHAFERWSDILSSAILGLADDFKRKAQHKWKG